MMKGLGASEGYGIGRVMLIVDQKLEYVAKEIADILRGNDCGGRGTSCADQLSIAIDKALEKQAAENV